MTGFRYFFSGWLVALASITTAFASPIGMVCAMKGRPTIVREGAVKALRLLQDLDPGNEIRCDKDSEATVVIFGNGHRYLVESGKSGQIQADAVAGARSLGGLKGPSAETVKNLAGSRAGAQMSRPTGWTIPARRAYNAIPDWLTEDERRLSLKPIPKAINYQFTMYDSYDNAVLTQIVTKPDIQIPPEVRLQRRYPYVWHLTGTLPGGTQCQYHYWGVLTFLSKADDDALKSKESVLRGEANQNPKDTLPPTLLAKLYHVYGLLLREIETLEELSVLYEPTDPAWKSFHEAAETVFMNEGAIGRLFSEYYKHHTDQPAIEN